MSVTGDLQYLPIVDVVQLLHSTRKSGILAVRGEKGESRLVFKEGYIVGASHLDNSVLIGKVLVDRGAVTREELDDALRRQATAADRKPLIVTLREAGMVEEREAYAALESLIEMTIVEILTWKTGTFTLQPAGASSCDDYRYYPETIAGEPRINTQEMLMEAVRVYDEMIRGGDAVSGRHGPAGKADDEEEDFLFLLEPTGAAATPGTPSIAAPAMSAADAVAGVSRMVRSLRDLKEVPEVVLAVMQYVSVTFPRTVTLIVRQDELVGERSIGLRSAGDRAPSAPLKFSIPRGGDRFVQEVIDSGRVFFGALDGSYLAGRLYKQIGAPAHPAGLLLPLHSCGVTLSMTYADFGAGAPRAVSLDSLEIVAVHAACLVENLLHRGRLMKR